MTGGEQYKRLVALGLALKKVRLRKRLSQRKVAAGCDLHHSEISRIENAKKNYNVTTLMELFEGMEMRKEEIDVIFETFLPK